jgi:hypothetical protein
VKKLSWFYTCTPLLWYKMKIEKSGINLLAGFYVCKFALQLSNDVWQGCRLEINRSILANWQIF